MFPLLIVCAVLEYALTNLRREMELAESMIRLIWYRDGLRESLPGTIWVYSLDLETSSTKSSPSTSFILPYSLELIDIGFLR